MAKKKIIFRLTAFSAAAGKYNPEAPLDGNEDNFYVDDDLNDEILGRFQTDEDIVMSDCGCLMVVADGMGGMNAGEVASELAIDTVKDYFAPGKITPDLAESPVDRRKYLEQVIKEADKRIKTDAKENPAHEGMGSTIILAWIVGDKMTVSWCGDSRAYRFNPINGLEPLSRDHSYVQELVNQGALEYEDTFEHPQGNIVTRSLGDPNNAAKPETRQFDVYNEDIILLCSDGLSGVLRDRKTKDHNGTYYPGENIEDIIAAHTSSMTECRDALLDAAEKADWYDNVTVLLCQIESGAGKAPKKQIVGQGNLEKDNKTKSLKNKIFLGAGGILLLVAILCGAFYYLGIKKGEAGKPDKGDMIAQTDSTKEDDVVVGVDVVEAAVAPLGENDIKKTDDKKRESKEGKYVKPTDDTKPDNTAPADIQAGVPQWKAFLLTKLSQYSQDALRNVVVSVRKTVNSAGDDDQQKCYDLVSQVEQRVDYLNKLHQYNGRLTRTGKRKFDALLAEIGNPKKFQPEYWDIAIRDLNRFLAPIDRELKQEELTPSEGESGGGDGTTDSPNELTEN